MAEITSEIPDDLARELAARVQDKEFRDLSDAVTTALRYFFERHQPAHWREYIREDIDWSRRFAER